MNNLGKKFEMFVIVAIIGVIGIIYAFRQTPAAAPTAGNSSVSQYDPSPILPDLGQASVNPNLDNPAQQPKQQVPSSVIEYAGIDGKNALELLQAGHKVDLQHFSFGDLVIGIDGMAPDAKHFWAMYVNGQFSQVGASAYMTKSTDTVKWQIDEVKN